MSTTYCSRLSCGKMSCEYHQYNAPKNKDISIADRNDGCFGLAEDPDKWYYCGQQDCVKTYCRFHISKAPVGIEAKVLELGCYEGPYEKRKELLAAICRGTQKTNYKCNDTCRALCGNDGTCAYCATIADSVEEVIK